MTRGVGRGCGGGEAHGGGGICLFRQRSHAVVGQKQTQHCKAVILERDGGGKVLGTGKTNINVESTVT